MLFSILANDNSTQRARRHLYVYDYVRIKISANYKLDGLQCI